jgi:hypothetical protein
MKTSLAVIIALISVLLYSCSSGTCSCTKACYSYAGGQIIYYPSAQDTLTNRLAKDSLTTIYGTERDSTVKIAVLHDSNSWSSYQSQGYSCGCTK